MKTYRQTLLEIKQYAPQNDLEKQEKLLILQALQSFKKRTFQRTNLPCHISVSCFVLNYQYNKVLFACHNIYKSYGWLGGHADGIYDLAYVAKKELQEESSLKNFQMIGDTFISLEVLDVMPHLKNNQMVPAHLHLNFTYAFLADENLDIQIKPDENSKINWLDIDKLEEYVSEKKMLTIYHKIWQRIKKAI